MTHWIQDVGFSTPIHIYNFTALEITCIAAFKQLKLNVSSDLVRQRLSFILSCSQEMFHNYQTVNLNHKFFSLEFISTEANFTPDCGGITYQPGEKMYTLRQGKVLKDSHYKEISWTTLSSSYCEGIVELSSATSSPLFYLILLMKFEELKVILDLAISPKFSYISCEAS